MDPDIKTEKQDLTAGSLRAACFCYAIKLNIQGGQNVLVKVDASLDFGSFSGYLPHSQISVVFQTYLGKLKGYT